MQGEKVQVSKMDQRKRYEYLDIVRGITLISMIVYHTMWDLVYIVGLKAAWYLSKGAYIWQQSICWTFILLAGFCWSFGRKKFRRGILVFLGGALITLVTNIVMPNQSVTFGVLTFLGTAMLLMIPLEKILRRIPAIVGLIVSVTLFLLTKKINRGMIGIGGLELVKLPKAWYDCGDLMTFLGFPDKDFYSTDYFSLFPWIFLFLSGYFLYRVAVKRKVLDWPGFAKIKSAPLAFIGRNSLLIYMLHQPVIYLIIMIINFIVKP